MTTIWRDRSHSSRPGRESLLRIGRINVVELPVGIRLRRVTSFDVLASKVDSEPPTLYVCQVPDQSDQRELGRRSGAKAELLRRQTLALACQSRPLPVEKRGQRGALVSLAWHILIFETHRGHQCSGSQRTDGPDHHLRFSSITILSPWNSESV